jgi:hypothetical protein
MYSAPDCPVRYADHSVVCADYPAIWPDRLVIYSNCLMLYTDGLNGSFRVHAVRGGLGVGLDNSFLKTGLVAAGSDGPCSRADGPVVRRLADLPPICVGGRGCPGMCPSTSRKGLWLVMIICNR